MENITYLNFIVSETRPHLAFQLIRRKKKCHNETIQFLKAATKELLKGEPFL